MSADRSSTSPGVAARRAALVASLLAVACADRPDLAPRPLALSPAAGAIAAPTAVTISGEGFLPRVVQSASGGPETVDARHRVFVGAQELADVAWIDTRTLRATVPAGLALGAHDVTVENAHGVRGVLRGGWTAIDPAALSMTASLGTSQASVGQATTLAAVVRNTGGTAIQGLTVTVSPSVAGVVTGTLASAPFQLDPSEVRTVSFPLGAAARGAVTLSASAAGAEAGSGRAVAAAATGLALVVQNRGALTASLAIPVDVDVGTTFQATLAVDNVGEATALAVAPGSLAATLDATGAVTVVGGPTPVSTAIAGGGRATFAWTLRLLSAGTVRLRAGAAGLDGNDGGPVVADPATSNAANVPEVVQVANDPFGDGSSRLALAARGGLLHVGPSADGRTFLRLDPATAATSLAGVQIPVAGIESPVANTSWRTASPATTFGSPTCLLDQPTCGPDNEEGLGLLASGTFGGTGRIVHAADAEPPRFLYVASDDGTPLSFSVVDLEELLTGAQDATTAIAFAPSVGSGERLYLAFASENGLESPKVIAIWSLPTGPLLDVPSSEALDLAVHALPRIGGNAPVSPNPDQTPRIDAMAWFGERLYLATNRAIARSTVVVPRSVTQSPSDWADATPTDPAWITSVRGGSNSTFATPASRTVAATAAFGGCSSGPCLYLARNVLAPSLAVAPQLWRCDPSRSGDLVGCDPGDWSLAAPNASGSTHLSQIGGTTNGALSLLVATPRYLYVGFDDATTGIQVFRSEVAAATAAEFRGTGGCVPGQPACAGLGGNGFGSASLTRIVDARAVTTAGGATTLYLLAGGATGPLRLFALPE